MNQLFAGAILLIMFVLRFAIPFVILLGLGYILNQIQNSWQVDNGMT
jgi:hypothetical protein